MLTSIRAFPTTISAAIVFLLVVGTAGGGTPGDYSGGTFAVKVESPTVKLGARALIVATISPADGYRITDAYRHRIVNLVATDGDVEIGRKVVRGAVKDGAVVFRVEVVPKTAGAHLVVGVFRFSITNGERLDIKAAPFEATVTATD